jgi:ribonuclease HI
VDKHKIGKTQTPTPEQQIEYTSGIGESFHTLPKHMQRLVGNIPDIDVTSGWEDNEEHGIIVAIDGSVVFGVGYHSWVVATKNEQVILSVGGADDGDQLLMTSYSSELGGIASGLAAIGTLVRSGKIKVKSVKLVCDKEAAIKACKIKCTQSVFHRSEEEHDLVSMIQYLQESWYQYTEVHYEWVKGHADDLNRDTEKLERLNIVADELCDGIHETARGPFGARPNCGLWTSERCALFIRGVKVMSNWKERLTQQLLDGDLQE